MLSYSQNLMTGRLRRNRHGKTGMLIDSIRRECLDYVVVFSERNLSQLIKFYQRYYNEACPHLSLSPFFF